MDRLDHFLSFYIDKMTEGSCVPIDLATVCGKIGAVVEEREMIPEAAMQPRDGRFHIYLQSNFKDLPGTTRRRRFTWAHEIGHTLFFEQRDGELKPRADAPRGDKLESACHRAASMILVPTNQLKVELRSEKVDGAARIVELADHFDVSVEVMTRRLNELSLFQRWAPVLTRRIGQSLEIQFAARPSWIGQHLTVPKRGMEFVAWFSATNESNRVLKRQNGKVTIEATPIEVSASLIIFELRERFLV